LGDVAKDVESKDALNDWAKLRRKAARSGVPRTVMYELATVSRVARPQAMMKAEPTKPPYFS